MPADPETARCGQTAPGPGTATDHVGLGILLVPAMGVAARFYEPFSARLSAACGTAAVTTLELPGQGAHPQRAGRGDDFGYREVVEEMVPAAVDALAARVRRVAVVGHSLGGQLAVLASAQIARRVDRLVLVAAGTAHWRAWPAGQRVRTALATFGIGAAAAMLPWYPGVRLGFGGNQARRFMRDWSYNARRGSYRLEGSRRTSDEIAAQLAAVRMRVHALTIADDPVAPPGALDELLSLLPQSDITRATVRAVASDSPWRRHFSWVRQATDIEPAIACELADLLSGSSA